ncbi:MAG TPA: hypothetical protein VGX68_07020, partial [Thermoanaerobaculia bacterium]|nr:hypothetical protein [Thermoanaerobaculia bacterium]
MTTTARRSGCCSIILVTVWCQLSSSGFCGRSFARQVTENATPTITAVQGDTLNGVDVASIFLTGCPYQCQEQNPQIDCSCRQTKYHAPDLWVDKKQSHLDPMSDYSCFYRDKRTKDANGTPGEDESAAYGLERSQIAFYAGEGTPENFTAIEGKRVNVGDFSLGDVSTRYLFMTSCNVLAHGPRAEDGDFSTPNLFDVSQFKTGQSLTGVAFEMANVFYSWGRDYGEGRYPLNPSLRLACGGSSLIGGAEEYGGYPTHLFWYYSSVRRLNPADAWLVGLYVQGKAEPLCISRGDSLKSSGLGDPWFETAPLTAGERLPTFVYIEYPVEGKADDPLIQAASSGLPGPPKQPAEAESYPVLSLTETSVPFILKEKPQGGSALGYGFLGGAASDTAHGLLPALFPPSPGAAGSVIRAEDVCVENNRASGSVAISWRPNLDNPNTEHELDTAAEEFLLRLIALFKDAEQQKPSEKEQKTSVQGVTAIQMKIGTVKAAELLTQPTPQDGCLYLRQTRSVNLAQAGSVRIFGEGSETFVGRCPAAAIRLEPSVPPQAQTNPCKRAGSPLATFVHT